MQFELTDSFLSDLRSSIDSLNGAAVAEQLKDLYPPDIAEVFNELKMDEAIYAYRQLDEQTAADVLVELEDDLRETLLESYTSKEIAEQFIDNMDSDDAADVIADLPDERQDEILSHMEDTDQANDIVDLLNYDEYSAGGLMRKEFVRVHVGSKALECVREIREQAHDLEEVFAIYVVDDDERLVGLLPLKKLIVSPVRSTVSDIYDPKVISIKANTPAEEVANVMDKYNLVAIPVVNALGRLIGVITIDDVVDYRRDEETEDVQKMAAMEALEEPYMNTSFLQMIKKRAGWLILLFVGETLTASVMSFFEGQIAKAVILAMFIPLIISSGGNSGSQASTLIIRALALGEISIRNWWEIVKKEFFTGLVIGLILGTIGFLRIVVWSYFVDGYGPHAYLIGLVVGFSLLGVVVWGTLMGSLFPLALKRLGLDPAVSSAPFVATLVDVTGLIIYFSFSILFLRGVLL